MIGPWHITQHAAERYRDLVPSAPRDLSLARQELAEHAAAIWERYERNAHLKPSITRTGAYCYRGGLPLRLRVVVIDRGASGFALVDVVGADLRRRAAAP
jgi:hypothetical protein